MQSQTPQNSQQRQAVSEAMQEGFMTAGFVFVPTVSAMMIAARRSIAFSRNTNWQSRTALAIMPAAFAFVFTAERYLHQNARYAETKEEQEELLKAAPTVESDQNALLKTSPTEKESHMNKTRKLIALYKDNLEAPKFNVVSGETLGFPYRLANYVDDNPLKVLAALSVPCIGLIYQGKAGEQHLQTSTKLLHTRVVGQFTTVSLLLSIMGFKDYMNRNGVFATEEEASRREEEMTNIRQQILDRLEQDHKMKKEELQQLQVLHKAKEPARRDQSHFDSKMTM